MRSTKINYGNCDVVSKRNIYTHLYAGTIQLTLGSKILKKGRFGESIHIPGKQCQYTC